MDLTITLTEEEQKLADEYATNQSMSVAEVFKKAFFEKLEHDEDVALANEAYEEYSKTGKQSRPIEELWNELNL